MILIDATNLILGRFATYVAKQALLGEEVRIINVEKAVVSGSRQNVLAEMKQDRARGTPAKGPFIPRVPDRYVRRVIRGMLPYKKAKGTEAFKRILCYKGVPDEFKDMPCVDMSTYSADKLTTKKHISVEDVLRFS